MKHALALALLLVAVSAFAGQITGNPDGVASVTLGGNVRNLEGWRQADSLIGWRPQQDGTDKVSNIWGLFKVPVSPIVTLQFRAGYTVSKQDFPEDLHYYASKAELSGYELGAAITIYFGTVE